MATLNNIVLVKGKVRWYYNIVADNGHILATSQKYFSKGNARRAAINAATRSKLEYKES